MRPALDSAGHRVPRTKPTCLLHTWRPHRRRPFSLVLHQHQHQSSRNLHLQYLAKNQSTQCCQSLITPGRGHPLVLEPHKVLNWARPADLGRPAQAHPGLVRSPLRSRGSSCIYALCPLHLHHFDDVILTSKMEVLRA
jgi:hypothetical protein